MPQELLFELNGARMTPHIATFGGTSYQRDAKGLIRLLSPSFSLGWVQLPLRL
jgi:hypothetical protein